MCPECGHGSPEIRDERAHLDAHRQLRAFFQEWDAGTESGKSKGRRSRRRLACLYAAVALVVVFLSVGVFSRINRDSGGQRASVPPIVIPDAAMIAPALPTAPVPIPVVTLTEPPAARPPQASPATSPAPTNTVRGDSFVPPPASAAGPRPAPPPATVPPPVVAPATPHVLHLCLLGICVTVL